MTIDAKKWAAHSTWEKSWMIVGGLVMCLAALPMFIIGAVVMVIAMAPRAVREMTKK